MYCVSVNLSSSEWIRINQAASRQWPRENLSRAEILRRYTLVGMETLKNLSTADRERLAHGFQMSQQIEDEHLRY